MGLEAAEVGLAADPPSAAARAGGPPAGNARRRLQGGARGPRAPRPAPRLRPLDGLAGARRRGAGHPVDPPERPLAGAARPRQVPAPHPGDGHQRDAPHRRRDRLGQAADQSDPLRSRSAGAAAGAGARTPRTRSTRPNGWVTRWSSSRSTATTARAYRSTSPPAEQVADGVREGVRVLLGGDRRDLPGGARLPDPGGQRQGRGGGRSACRATSSGDGRHTVAELVEIVNQRSPARHRPREGADPPGDRPPGRRGCWSRRGWGPTTVLPEGQVFYLRSTGNLSTGGTSVDKTDVIHYDNRIMAERAVKAIGLDVGGVDFISPDITRSYKEVGGAIVRDQRRAGLPHAHRAHGGQAARRGRAGDRHAVPAGDAVPHPDRRHHRHQRQDDHDPHGGAHPQALRATRWA